LNTGRKHIMNQIFSPFALALILGIIIVTSGCGEAAPAASQDALQKQEEIEKELTEGNVVLSGQELSTYGSIQSCQIQEDQETVSLMLEMPDIPKSDDPMVYLFAFDLYETCEFDEELEYKIVGSTEANSLKGKISNESPVGRALLGKKVGDQITVETQMGELSYKVLEIQRSTV